MTEPGSTSTRTAATPSQSGSGSVSPAALAQVVADILAGRHPQRAAALATVVGRSGSAPQILGARMLVIPEGEGTRNLGTVGGGAIEHQVEQACRQVLRSGRSRVVSANLVRDLGMCCGGAMEVFVEFIQAQARLIIIGGGHVSQALGPMARTLGFEVLVLDDREDMLADPAFEGLECLPYDADELADAVPNLGANDFLVIVTRDHARDERALAQALELPHGYIGMIGSRRKVHTVLARVLRRYDERDRPRPDMGRLRAPVGLALGGRTPPEIALSICAELVAWRHGGEGKAMSIVEEAAARAGSTASSEES